VVVANLSFGESEFRYASEVDPARRRGKIALPAVAEGTRLATELFAPLSPGGGASIAILRTSLIAPPRGIASLAYLNFLSPVREPYVCGLDLQNSP
jgi:hypothetical protein